MIRFETTVPTGLNICQFRALIINVLVVLVVLTGVTQNFFEMWTVFHEKTYNFTTYEGPIVFKLFKDVFVIFLIIFSLIFGWSKRYKPLTPETIFCMLLIVFLMFFSSISNGVLIATSGLRWFLPILLFMVFRSFTGVVKIAMLTNFLYVLLLFCVIIQILQLFLMPPLYGTIGPNLAARVPGFFIFPNTTAFFASVVTSCVLVYSASRFMQISSIILCIISSLLAQSGTGILVSLFLLLFFLFGRYRKLLIVFAPLILIPVLFFLDEITGRENFLVLSGGGRLEVFFRIILSEFASLDSLGLYTNTGVLASGRFLNNEDNIATIADSMPAAMVGNLGLFSLLVVILLLCYLRNRTKVTDWAKLMPIVWVYLLFSFTTIISEAYPMNLLLTFLLWSSPTLATYRNNSITHTQTHA